MECAAGHFSDLAAGLIVRPAKSCARRHHCMPGLLKARPARRGCLYQTAFCLAFVVWVLVCSSSLGRHSQTSPPPPPPERPGAACRARTPGRDVRAHPREMPMPIPVPPRIKPCMWWGQSTKPGQGAALPPAREVWLSLAFFPGFLRYSAISLVTPGCLCCACQTLGFL